MDKLWRVKRQLYPLRLWIAKWVWVLWGFLHLRKRGSLEVVGPDFYSRMLGGKVSFLGGISVVSYFYYSFFFFSFIEANFRSLFPSWIGWIQIQLIILNFLYIGKILNFFTLIAGVFFFPLVYVLVNSISFFFSFPFSFNVF